MLNKKVTHTVKRLKVMGEIQQVSSVGFCREGLQVCNGVPDILSEG